MNFFELATLVLNESKMPMTANEIWDYAKLKGYDKEINSIGKTPWATLSARLYVDHRDNLASEVKLTDTRPQRFYLGHLPVLPLPESELVLEVDHKNHYIEKDLHPFLVYYASNYMKAYLKTVKHSESSRSDYGEWVHPDIVGWYYPLNAWNEEVANFTKVLGDIGLKTFSFELKKDLSISNLREAFFQAVSNSSWANEGYLVAANISKNEDFRDELKRLSVSFGIGVIELDIEDPDSTTILYPAKEREKIDWEMVDKLARKNVGFKDFLKRVRLDFNANEIRSEWYDRVLDRESLIKTINK